MSVTARYMLASIVLCAVGSAGFFILHAHPFARGAWLLAFSIMGLAAWVIAEVHRG